MILTGFFEKGVPEVAVNPDNYTMQWRKALHCVRYEVGYFESLLNESGFRIDRFDYDTESDGQSAIYASKGGDGNA